HDQVVAAVVNRLGYPAEGVHARGRVAVGIVAERARYAQVVQAQDQAAVGVVGVAGQAAAGVGDRLQQAGRPGVCGGVAQAVGAGQQVVGVLVVGVGLRDPQCVGSLGDQVILGVVLVGVEAAVGVGGLGQVARRIVGRNGGVAERVGGGRDVARGVAQ